jgi:hypothetical protein
MIALLLVASTPASKVVAQSGGAFNLTWSSIEAGGGSFSMGNGYVLGGTIGQPAPGAASSGAGFQLAGGLWAGIPPAPVPTATASTMGTNTPMGGPTATEPPMGTAAMTSPPTPTPTPPRPPCVGDCNHDGRVSVDELITGVNIALGTQIAAVCPAFDANGDGKVTVSILITAVNNLLSGCPASAADAANDADLW